MKQGQRGPGLSTVFRTMHKDGSPRHLNLWTTSLKDFRPANRTVGGEGGLAEAARRSGINRTHLFRLIRKYGLARPGASPAVTRTAPA